MLIGGIQKLSLIDYPGKVATIVFSQGCSFRCHFCHNQSLVLKEKCQPPIFEESFFSFLDTRKGKIDAVVVSGGEPTLQSDLINFLKKIKEKGFLIKLDSSGIFPDVIEDILNKKLIDYIAMDIKAPINKYPLVVGKKIATNNIEKSVSLIKNSSIPYEFRTTLLPSLHTHQDVLEIFNWLSGSDLYILQKFIPGNTLNPEYTSADTFTNKQMEDLVNIGKNYFKNCFFR
jgi:pyruvate formate lyase activating enzyme